MCVDWKEYEKQKKLLPNNLTPAEYEIEIQKILEKLERKMNDGTRIF